MLKKEIEIQRTEKENLIPNEKILQEGIKEYFLITTDTKAKEQKLSKQRKKFLRLFGLSIIVKIIKQASILIKEKITAYKNT